MAKEATPPPYSGLPVVGQVWRTDHDGLYVIVAVRSDGVWCKRSRGYEPEHRYGDSFQVHGAWFREWDLVTPASEPPVGARAEAYDAALERLARELASFTAYPLEENISDGKCSACGFPVRAHHGVIALGADERGTFAAHLHRGCAADVQWAKAHPPQAIS